MGMQISDLPEQTKHGIGLQYLTDTTVLMRHADEQRAEAAPHLLGRLREEAVRKPRHVSLVSDKVLECGGRVQGIVAEVCGQGAQLLRDLVEAGCGFHARLFLAGALRHRHLA